MYRPVKKSIPNSGYSEWAYIIDKEYSQNPEHYIRAFSIIQNDIFRLFEYIEPSDDNLKTHSFRIHELFTRICIELESNFKAILNENKYTPKDSSNKLRKEKQWKFDIDYKLVNKSHHLDEYKAIFPIWNGDKKTFQPFLTWKNNETPSWWSAYNKSKHNRNNEFKSANFENLLNSYAALFIVLTSQFLDQEFKPGPKYLQEQGYCYYGGGFGIGGYLIPDLPENWNNDELYNFNWETLKKEEIRFQKFDYDAI